MNKSEVFRLLHKIGISVDEVTHIKGSFEKDIFLIDNKYVLRPSTDKMDDQVACFRRIEHMNWVPKIVKSGSVEAEVEAEKENNFILLIQIQGVEYFTQIDQLNLQENNTLGASLASFLDELHNNLGSTYDIGHYVPVIKEFSGTWKDGHKRYWEFLYDNIGKVELSSKSRRIVNKALSFFTAHQDSLHFQSGPVLLHNDLHPKNIILNNKRFSGVIDWECSQYGEADFDLCHLFHWCLFPSRIDYAFGPVLKTLLESSIKCTKVPQLWERLSIYQVEHELIQLIWSNGASENERIPRIEKWINNEIESFVRRLQIGTEKSTIV